MTPTFDATPALSVSEPQQQPQTEQERPKVGYRYCSEARKGGPSCN
ncbi:MULTISPECIES: hypothetical protein [unclassified Arthrobacter]